MVKKITFESNIKRLQQIVQILEEEESSLEDTLKLYEEGTKLAGLCYETLEKAKQKVSELAGNLPS